MSGELILVVDDEPNIIRLGRMYLEQDGYRVIDVGDGEKALEKIQELRPDLILLDLMLPKIDGMEVCRHLRSKRDYTPILMLTARGDDIDKILGLELGADDYMTKPFNPREMVARVRAILRRGQILDEDDKNNIHISDLSIDITRHEVKINNVLVELRNQEFNLLKVLIENVGIVLAREKLLELAWGYDFYGETRTVDVHIAHLRKKLSHSSITIETITGLGYKLVA
jgi:DNA-binding response OmpR family regulator